MFDLSFGQPQLSEYHPQITVRDLKSPNSRTKRIKGYKTGRVHHLLSDFESKYFYLLEWADNIADIREQFPLNLQETTRIARESGIKHPAYKDELTVMTTDFLITINNHNVIARTLKYTSELENERVLDKFSIEKKYWDSKGVDWGIVTENEINDVFVSNIKHFIRYKNYIAETGIDKRIVRQIIDAISEGDSGLKSILTESDFKYGLEKGRSLAIFNCLVGNKIFSINMLKKFSISIPSSEIDVTGAL